MSPTPATRDQATETEFCALLLVGVEVDTFSGFPSSLSQDDFFFQYLNARKLHKCPIQLPGETG